MASLLPVASGFTLRRSSTILVARTTPVKRNAAFAVTRLLYSRAPFSTLPSSPSEGRRAVGERRMRVTNSRILAEKEREASRHSSQKPQKSTERIEKTLKTSGEHRDFIEKVFPKRQYRQMMREETAQVVADNYAKRGDTASSFRQSYKSEQRLRKTQRGLEGQEQGEEQTTASTSSASPTARGGTTGGKTTAVSASVSSSSSSEKKIYTMMKSSTSTAATETTTPTSTTTDSPANPTNPRSSSSIHATSTPLKQEEVIEPNRPFTLPPGSFRPKQSLGQNYLSDQNYVNKIVSAFHMERLLIPSQLADTAGKQVLEIGPGTGALSRTLHPMFPEMLAVEIDSRAIEVLNEKLPKFRVQQGDILKFQFEKYSREVLQGKKISIVANLPYNIVSQVLFSLADAHKVIDLATVTMQWELAERITAAPKSRDYGIPSVILQLYGTTKINFKIPPTVFFPVPKVDSALITIDFTKPHPLLEQIDKGLLKRVISTAFRQRRKMLRSSLKDLLAQDGLSLPVKWQELRPEQLKPVDFIHMTMDLYGERARAKEGETAPVWRNTKI